MKRVITLLAVLLSMPVVITTTSIARGAPLMDVYLPADPTTEAVIVIHGGGWRTGSRSGMARACKQVVVPLGYACFAPDYSLNIPYPAPNDDIMAAYQAVKDLGYTEISAWGVSSGGTLAAWLATNVELETLITFSALTNLERLQHLRIVQAYAPTKPQRLAASPALHESMTHSALIVNSLHETVPAGQARALARRYATNELHLLEGTRHGMAYLDDLAPIVSTWLSTPATP